MNMVIMCHVHHVTTEKEEEKLQIMPKSTPIDNN